MEGATSCRFAGGRSKAQSAQLCQRRRGYRPRAVSCTQPEAELAFSKAVRSTVRARQGRAGRSKDAIFEEAASRYSNMSKKSWPLAAGCTPGFDGRDRGEDVVAIRDFGSATVRGGGGLEVTAPGLEETPAKRSFKSSERTDECQARYSRE